MSTVFINERLKPFGIKRQEQSVFIFSLLVSDMYLYLVLLVVAIIVAGAATAVAIKRVWVRTQNKIAFLEARVDALETYQDWSNRFIRNNDAFLREMWNSRGTLRAILHPNQMANSYETSGTAEQASEGTAQVFFVCYNPASDQMFFRPTVLSNAI